MNRDEAIRRLKNAAEILQVYVFDDDFEEIEVEE